MMPQKNVTLVLILTPMLKLFTLELGQFPLLLYTAETTVPHVMKQDINSVHFSKAWFSASDHALVFNPVSWFGRLSVAI